MTAARGDPKKSGVVLVLSVTLFSMCIRMVISPVSGAGPSRAGGAVTRSSAMSGNATANASLDPTLAPAKPGAVDQRLRDWLAEPARPISRNLFAVKLDYYPSDPSRPPEAPKWTADGEFWAKLEKSLILQADQQGRRDNLVANYEAAAGRIRLDSIMMGPQPQAMIDGKLVRVGDVAAGFRVLKIEPRRIVIEREGIKLEIQMK
jgi:hypothetical protein